ncbi:MAG: hypothetical protein JAY96_21125 [Candidatus Thiodiazotropha endolucinida]|nr:hypothetical protein [Candidatus Thiodiazotropha taylori]MCW4250699.1 hypothetical protein [Candidatus Thiodiazotropha endolucinida]
MTPLNFHRRAATIECLNEQIHYSSDIDGFLSLSENADLGFVRTPLTNIGLSKKSLIYWKKKQELKGLQVYTWEQGLPVVPLQYGSPLSLSMTFLPKENGAAAVDCVPNTRFFKKLYDSLFEFIIPNAIERMPQSCLTRAHNSPGADKYMIYNSEVGLFSEAFKIELERSVENPEFSNLQHISVNFILMHFGQCTPYNHTSENTYAKLVIPERAKEILVHLATDLEDSEQILLWDARFIDKLFHHTGSTYYSCGFHKTANGMGRVPRSLADCHILPPGIRYLKCYSTVFKRMSVQEGYYKPALEGQRFLYAPILAKILSLQPRSIASFKAKKIVNRDMVDTWACGIAFKILNHRLSMLRTNSKLHNARIEFVVSLKDMSWEDIRLDFTGHAVASLLSDMCLVLFGTEQPILYRLPSDTLSEFLGQEIQALLFPIKRVTDAFFQRQKPVTPDELETVHLCEWMISFIIYGTRNYLPNLRNIGLNIGRFQTLNRITLAYAQFRRQGQNFLLDGSVNSSGRVYTIEHPVGPKTSDYDQLTRRLLQIHEHVCKLDIYSVAINVLYYLMLDIHGYASNFKRDIRGTDPKRIFSRSVLQTAGLCLRDTPTTVEDFVAGLMSVQPSSSNSVADIWETGVEVLSDLYDQDGQILLKEGLDTVIHCSLKGNIPVEIYCAPTMIENRLNMSTWACIIPDVNQVLLDRGTPPLFHALLLRRVLIIANRVMGKLKPFPLGIAEIPNWTVSLLYTLIRNGCRDHIRTIRRLGCAMALKDSDQRQHQKVLSYARNHQLDITGMLRLGVLVQGTEGRFTVHEDDSFSYRMDNVLTAAQKLCMIVHGRLNAVGLNDLS